MFGGSWREIEEQVFPGGMSVPCAALGLGFRPKGGSHVLPEAVWIVQQMSGEFALLSSTPGCAIGAPQQAQAYNAQDYPLPKVSPCGALGHWTSL